ncbi:MAG: hypothetical protein KGJ32_07730 [Xanthomonadaceae bacterium]|nr:hypothetical protein [Xanthomonadaceae bacterium]
MNLPGNPNDRHIEQRARELYREACRRIDPVTAGRLRAARRQALETAHAPHRRFSRWLIPGGALAVLALATLMVWRPLPHGTAASSVQPGGSYDAGTGTDNELPPDADKTDPNLYQNLDFYGWLAANDSRPANR